MTPGVLNSQEAKGDFVLRLLNFNMGFTSYWTCLESLRKSLSGVERCSPFVQATPRCVGLYILYAENGRSSSIYSIVSQARYIVNNVIAFRLHLVSASCS